MSVLIDALKFYAERRNILDIRERGSSVHGGDDVTSIDRDDGETARAALDALNIPYEERYAEEDDRT